MSRKRRRKTKENGIR